MALMLKASLTTISQLEKRQCLSFSNFGYSSRKKCSAQKVLSMSSHEPSTNLNIPIMVNSCTGQMGKAIIKEANTRGLQVVPVSFGSEDSSGKTVEIHGKQYRIHGPSDDRETILASVFDKHPDLIIVDFTVPSAVNDNAELYCKCGVPFVMGTKGGDRDMLYKIVTDSEVYAVISHQICKNIALTLKNVEDYIQKNEDLSGYTLKVLCLDKSKVNISATIKAIISCFQRVGAFIKMVEVKADKLDPHIRRFSEEHAAGDLEERVGDFAAYLFSLQPPMVYLGDLASKHTETVGRALDVSITTYDIAPFAEDAVDAAIFLSKKVQLQADKRIYDTVDILQEDFPFLVW